MLNDEQILLKATQLLENFDISDKKPNKLLRELDETELEAIEDVLDDMKGEDLAFNDLFDGAMRKVIDFPTMDTSTELGQFAEFFKSQEYDIDWEKGMASAVRDVSTSDDLLNQLTSMEAGRDIKPKTKKIQMKIGKLFAKIADLARKKQEIYKNVEEFQKDEDYKRIQKQIRLYVPNPGTAGPAGYKLSELATKHGQYWQKNAGYIKKEINRMDNDKYSIIVTRHPIDVMRMSDFDNISSCHSPPSRGGGSQEYYKCAVAEAMGHGALAYVVETEDLLHLTNTSNIDSAEQEIQEGEIFADDNRGSGIGLDGDLRPVSRARLRQVRYYDTGTPARFDDGTQIAMPEERVYGAGIPGLVDRVIGWIRVNQEKAIKSIPTNSAGGIDLSRFMIFGGSYEDTQGETGRRKLMAALLGRPIGDFEGGMKQNDDTEQSLDANALSGLAGQWRNQVEQTTEEWNRRYANTEVDADVEDDHDGGFYINVRATMQWEWALDEFSKLPNSYPTGMQAFDSINDIWGNIFDSSDGFINKFSSSRVRIGCTINLDHPDVWGGGNTMHDPEDFEDLCQRIDNTMDDSRDAYQATIEEFLKREGYMAGGEYIKLATEIEDGDVTSYEWDLETDGDYSESYESTGTVTHDFNPEALGVSPQVLTQILDSRDWKLAIRSALIGPAKQVIGTEYHLDIGNSRAVTSGEDIEYYFEFKITADDPDERVELFREVVTGDMDDEDELNTIFDKVLAQLMNSRMPASQQQNLDERLVRTWKGFLAK